MDIRDPLMILKALQRFKPFGSTKNKRDDCTDNTIKPLTPNKSFTHAKKSVRFSPTEFSLAPGVLDHFSTVELRPRKNDNDSEGILFCVDSFSKIFRVNKKEEEKKKRNHSTQDSRVVPHRGTN
jgi:hypothetical protein